MLFISLSRYFSLKSCKKCSRYSTWGIPSVLQPLTNSSSDKLISQPSACESNLQSVPDHCHHMQIPIWNRSHSLLNLLQAYTHTHLIVMSTFPFSSPSPQVPFRYVCECCFSAICGMENFYLFSPSPPLFSGRQGKYLINVHVQHFDGKF